MKQQLHDKKSAVVTYEYACGHESEIIAMKRKIEQTDKAIETSYERLQQQVAVKEREIHNAQDKLTTSKKELDGLHKRKKQNDSQNVVSLNDKVKRVTQENKELQLELISLKRLQKTQGLELVQNSGESKPARIKSLLEQVRVARENQIELIEKTEQETRQEAKNEEMLRNVTEEKEELQERLDYLNS